MATLTRGGADIHYDLLDLRPPWHAGGDDDVIVFHHGLGACADVWRGWDPALAERFRLLRLDMRGHGRSRTPAGFRWSIEALADDLEAVVDDAGLGRFHLVGESIGGTTALMFASRHPGRVRTLTVCNGAHRGEEIQNLAPWRRILADGGIAAWSSHMMKQRFHDGALTPQRAGWYQEQQATCDPECVMPAAEALAGVDLTPGLDRVTMPTLLLHPDASPFIPVHVMAELDQALPDARLQVFARARHGLPYSHDKACAAVLAAFLEEC